MKKSLYLIVCMLGSILYAQAQEALYFHCKDGKSFACTIDEIDHIGFSKVGDSEYNNQIVYLKDSTQVEVLLEDVDSVGFTNPAPVLKDNGFIMDKSFMAYVSDADTLKFTMAKDTPASMLPKKGDVVASTYDNTAFPDGIMARVISITETANGYLYECEKAGIDDLYEEFLYCGYGIDTGNGARTRDGGEIAMDLWNITVPPAKMPAIIVDKFTFDSDFRVSSKGKVKVLLRKNKGESTYARLTLAGGIGAKLDMSVTGMGSTTSVTPLTNTLTLGVIATPVFGIFFKPTLGLGLYTEAAADLKASFKAHANYDFEYILEMKDGNWSAREGKKTSDVDIDECSISIDGWVGFGLQPEVFMSFCGTKTGTTVQTRIGLRFQANFKFDARQYYENNSFYEGIKDSKIAITVPVTGWFNAQAGLFGPAVKSADIYFMKTFLPIPIPSAYFVPAFTDVVVDDAGSGNYGVSTNLVDRIVFMPCQIGLAAFDKDNKLVEAQYLAEYSLLKKPKSISTTFKLDATKSYTFAPIIKLFGAEMRANGTSVEGGIIGTWFTYTTFWTDEMLRMDGYTRDQVDKRAEIFKFYDNGKYDWYRYYYPGIWETSGARVWSLEDKESGTWQLDDDYLTLSGSPGVPYIPTPGGTIRLVGDQFWYGLFYGDDGRLYGYTLYKATEDILQILSGAK